MKNEKESEHNVEDIEHITRHPMKGQMVLYTDQSGTIWPAVVIKIVRDDSEGVVQVCDLYVMNEGGSVFIAKAIAHNDTQPTPNTWDYTYKIMHA